MRKSSLYGTYFRRLVYYLLLALLYPVSWLPLPMLYGLSSITRLVMFGLFGYRKKIVADNLAYAFPEKTPEERARIQRSFERNFCDQWVETLKALSISKAALQQRVTGNWEVFEQLDREGKNSYALLGHFFNWEWASIACQWAVPQQFSGVYLPLNSIAFDRLMQRIRTRGGAWLISMKAVREGMERLQGVRYMLGLIADQNPSQPDKALWVPFMNREAPFFLGPEGMAQRAGGAVVFAAVRRAGRGRYKAVFERKWDNARDAAPGEITQAYVSFLEAELRADPANWLWSHRRWKHRKR